MCSDLIDIKSKKIIIIFDLLKRYSEFPIAKSEQIGGEMFRFSEKVQKSKNSKIFFNFFQNFPINVWKCPQKSDFAPKTLNLSDFYSWKFMPHEIGMFLIIGVHFRFSSRKCPRKTRTFRFQVGNLVLKSENTLIFS